jgi:hypothetical protein
MKKNTFYELKNYDFKDHDYKYVRVDDIVEDSVYFTSFTENMVEGEKYMCSIAENTLTELPKTLETLCVGDLVYDGDSYKKVLGVINQNCYVMSEDVY